jgi:GNAT superfamily N-acetyltransferase
MTGVSPRLRRTPRGRYGSTMGERPALFLGLLADQPELIAEVGVLRWRAAGQGGTPAPWIESTARDAGRDRLPLTLVAMDLEGRAIGAVTLGLADGTDHDGAVAAGCPPGAPWVARLVVRPGERLCGVGRLLVAAAEDLARQHGHDQVWVAAESVDVEFYRHCGWQDDSGAHADVIVLSKALASA